MAKWMVLVPRQNAPPNTGGAERASRRERRDGEGGERSNEGARGRQGPGKEQAGSDRASRHR